jgi:hypothetical protein
MKALLGRAITDKQVSFDDLSMQLEYTQLQIKALDKKVFILASNTT